MRAWEAKRRTLRTGAAGALLLLPAGCDIGQVSTYDPEQPAAQEAVLTLLAEDTSLSRQLGWTGGGIPGAAVVVELLDTDDPWTWSGVADSLGMILLTELRPGRYRLEVRRLLDGEERARIGGGGVHGFVAGFDLVVGATAGQHLLPVPAARSGGLVISELYHHRLQAAGGPGEYSYTGYTELYNNADTTIYLDGKVFGQGFGIFHGPPERPCAATAPLRVDPAGIWSIFFEQIPGTGRQYPLAPGAAAVIATDAIDHGPFVLGGLGPDLRGADFESIGTGDVDNPAVPNLVNIGLRQNPRGMAFSRSGVTFIAEAVDPLDLPRTRDDMGANEYARIPAEKILNVAVTTYDSPLSSAPRCPELSHPLFARSWADFTPLDRLDGERTMHRKPLLELPGGRVLLQHTNWPHADFTVTPRSPGSVPRP